MTSDELQAEHCRLALSLSMACTLTLAKASQIPPEFAAVCAKEIRRVARLTEDGDLPLAAQMNSLAFHLAGR